MILGALVSAIAIALGFRAREASVASLQRRLSWSVRLVQGYGGLLLACVLVPLARFLWLGAEADPSERALVLGSAIAATLNLILGFAAFGTAPGVVAVMLSRRLRSRQE
jgi:hypothetical protein